MPNSTAIYEFHSSMRHIVYAIDSPYGDQQANFCKTDEVGELQIRNGFQILTQLFDESITKYEARSNPIYIGEFPFSIQANSLTMIDTCCPRPYMALGNEVFSFPSHCFKKTFSPRCVDFVICRPEGV